MMGIAKSEQYSEQEAQQCSEKTIAFGAQHAIQAAQEHDSEAA
jgi:hypothetical protein